MIRALQVVIDVPREHAPPAAGFWSAALGDRLGSPWADHPELRSFEPADTRPYVHLQEAVAGPRVHIDAEVDDRLAGRDRLLELGASAGPSSEHWQVMTSPGGLPFCLLDHHPAPVPAPRHHPDGHRSRLVQVCIDSPAERHEAEIAFWRAATEWAWTPSEGEEFAGKLRSGPCGRVQLLLQRLGQSDRGTEVRAHIDLGTDDRPAEVARLVALGATAGPVGGGWQVLTDPVGMEFCVTDNPPD